MCSIGLTALPKRSPLPYSTSKNTVTDQPSNVPGGKLKWLITTGCWRSPYRSSSKLLLVNQERLFGIWSERQMLRGRNRCWHLTLTRAIASFRMGSLDSHHLANHMTVNQITHPEISNRSVELPPKREERPKSLRVSS